MSGSDSESVPNHDFFKGKSVKNNEMHNENQFAADYLMPASSVSDDISNEVDGEAQDKDHKLINPVPVIN